MGFKLPPKQITRQNIERVAGAPDRRQFDNFDTTGVFTGGDGLAGVGEVLTGMAGDQLQQLEADARHFAQAETVELKARKDEDQLALQGYSSGVNTRAKDQHVKYQTDSQNYVRNKLAEVDKEEGRSIYFRERYKQQLQGQLLTHNASVKKTIRDLTTTKLIGDVKGEYAKQTQLNEKDLPEQLRQFNKIREDYMLELGEAESMIQYNTAAKAAALSNSNAFLTEGDTTAARKALEDPLVRRVIGADGRAAQMKIIRDTEFQAAVNKKVDEKAKDADDIINMGEQGLWSRSLNDGKGGILPGSADPNNSTITHASGIWKRNKAGILQLVPGSAPETEDIINMGEQGLWSKSLNDGKGGILPGSADPNNSTITHTSGIWKRNKEGILQLVPGSAPPEPQTDTEKLDEKLKWFEANGVPATPALVKEVGGLKVKEQTELGERLEVMRKYNIPHDQDTILALIGVKKETLTQYDKDVAYIENLPDTFSEEDKQDMRLQLIFNLKQSAVAEKKANLDDMLERGVINKETHTRGMISLNTVGDIRTPEERGTDDADEAVAKANRLKELGFTDRFDVDSKASTLINRAAGNAIGVMVKAGAVVPLDAEGDLQLDIAQRAEKRLLGGLNTTINAAVYDAVQDIRNEDPDRFPTRITGLSQIEAMEGQATAPTAEQAEARRANRDALITEMRDPTKSRAELEGILQKLDAIQLREDQFETKHDFDRATGVVSWFHDLLGSTISQIPGLEQLENVEVTKARLLFSLIARDVVRMISLSPRYAVKEQELIQSIFSGPGIFNSPRQARNKVLGMIDFIDERMRTIKQTASRTNIDPDKESELVEEASRLLEIKGRMNKFEFNIIEVKNVAGLDKLSDEQVKEYRDSFSSEEIDAMSDDMAIAIDKRLNPEFYEKGEKSDNGDEKNVDKKKVVKKKVVKKKAVDAFSNVSEEQVDEYVDSLFDENPDFNAANLEALGLPHTDKGDAIRDKAREQISSRKSKKKKSSTTTPDARTKGNK